jgi:DNA-binding response OmpR family regulator
MPTTIKLLIIEDNTMLAQMYKEEIEYAGFELLIAPNGIEGLRLSQTADPHLILLDLMLPDMDGLTVLKKIKDNPITQNIPVIIMTNFYSAENVKDAMAKGAADYILKADVTPGQVVKRINTVLQKKTN